MKKLFLFYALLLIIFVTQRNSCFCEEQETAQNTGIIIDLRYPVYSAGVLTTSQGGIVTGPDLRIQAMNISYSRHMEEGKAYYTLSANGNLILEYGEYIFVGESLDYDFKTKTGTIINGRTMISPWFFGGDKIHLHEDGSYTIEKAYVTTSENIDVDWQFYADEVTVNESTLLTANNAKLDILGLPVFWIPKFKLNLNAIFDSPIKYSVKWGGNQGHRFGLSYELFSWNRWRTFLRLDYRLKHGPGGGLETVYRSLDHKTSFNMINYVASDSSIIHPGETLRYRFMGIYDSLFLDDKVSVHLSYDKLSDIDMPTDYNDYGLTLDTAGRTELIVRRQEENWITNFITRFKINNFQTAKEELPTIETSWRPFELASTGIILDNTFKASYLDFSYGNNQLNVHNFHSTRVEYSPLFYKPIEMGPVTATPEVGTTLIAYGNSPDDEAKWLAVGKFGCAATTSLSRYYRENKHVITPHLKYNYYTSPTVSPNDHYIFDIDDGWSRLNMLNFGLAQTFYNKQNDGLVSRPVFCDLYANAFFDTKTFSPSIPKIYGDIVYTMLPNLKYTLQSGWDFIHQELDHFNVRADWTINADAAFGIEYRHRSAYDWRKADHTNFIIDSYRTVNQLYESLMSDRRDTILFHTFYRFHPSWAFEFESRHGWNRRFEPSYNEFEVDLIGTLRSAWNIRFSYQHKECDDRVSVYMSIGIKRPSLESSGLSVPYID